MSHLRLALLLGMTVALGPFALDTYLPAFPAIGADLGAEPAAVGRTLAAYVAVFGAGQLLGGPLSDRYGRRPVLLAGLAIFAVAAAMVAQAQTLAAMSAWRAVQGLGGAFCGVSVPAIVRDRTRGNEAARLFGLIGLVMFVAPAAAPGIGSLLLWSASWQAIFIALAVYAALLAILLQRALFRHLPTRTPDRTPVRTLLTNYVGVFRSGATMRFVGIQAMAFSVMLVFLTHASFIYQGFYGLSNTAFSLLFAANIAAMAGINLVNRRLLRHYDASVVLRGAVISQSIAAAALLLLGANQAPVTAVAPAIIATVACMGAIAPNNMANVLEFFPTRGATAAAVLGATQLTCAGLISAASTWIAGDTLTPIVVTMALAQAGALALALRAPTAMRRALAREARQRAAAEGGRGDGVD